MEVGALVLGDNLPDPVTGARPTHAERHRGIVDFAVRSEALGFDLIWIGEHHFCDYVVSSPALLLAAIAERTRRIRLGTGVTLLGLQDPVRVAEDFATLDVLSGGRAEVAVGRGVLKQPYADFGLAYNESNAILEERVELLLRLWTETDVAWSGSFRAPLDGVTVMPRPVQSPHPPLWVAAGTSAQSIAFAAKRGLPLMIPGIFVPVEVLRPVVEGYREAFLAAGHDARSMRVGFATHVHVAEDGETARARWEPFHMAYIRWVFEELLRGRGESHPEGLLPDYEALIHGGSICGSASEVTERLLAAKEMLELDTCLALFDNGPLPEALLHDSVERFAADVLPHLR
jgi:alkanesulfonate monooxygenase SsuD/methylene tetrahydromethanopterin reductase-like flavin-dependent oxidoreductase (luciferase family)